LKTHVKKYPQVEVLPLETKRSGGKLLPHSDLRWGVFLEEVLCNRKRDIVLGTWNVRSLYRAGSPTAVARELARYKLDFVGVQEVRWNKRGTVRAEDYKFSMEKEMKIISWEQVFLYTIE
jgi:dolichyl-phosphate-mannose--protein O-mannosyl transferase